MEQEGHREHWSDTHVMWELGVDLSPNSLLDLPLTTKFLLYV